MSSSEALPKAKRAKEEQSNINNAEESAAGRSFTHTTANTNDHPTNVAASPAQALASATWQKTEAGAASPSTPSRAPATSSTSSSTLAHHGGGGAAAVVASALQLNGGVTLPGLPPGSAQAVARAAASMPSMRRPERRVLRGLRRLPRPQGPREPRPLSPQPEEGETALLMHQKAVRERNRRERLKPARKWQRQVVPVPTVNGSANLQLWVPEKPLWELAEWETVPAHDVPVKLNPSVSLHLTSMRQHLAELKEHLKLAKARIRADYEPESLPQIIAEATSQQEPKTASSSVAGSHNVSRAATPALSASRAPEEGDLSFEVKSETPLRQAAAGSATA